MLIGRYDPTAREARGAREAEGRGLTLAEARRKAAALAKLQHETGDVKAHRQEQERLAEISARKGTLRQLLAAYILALRDAGKSSAGKAEGIFRKHVLQPFPKVADTKASEIEPGDIQRILARLVRAGRTRQVNKARSYIRAAFEHGLRADHDPRTVASDGVLFGLKFNPAATVPRIAAFERAGTRALSEDELRAYWVELDRLPLVQKAALRLNLALACQRPTQLLRATWPEFDFEQKTLLLRDGKGRGGAHDHLLPLTGFALEQLKPLRDLNSAESSPFVAVGTRKLALETLSKAVREISDRLKRESGIPSFQMRDIRRTAETMLQKMGVDREIRAHLLSHGRAQGVQGKHYERYDFLKEKRVTLEKWARHIERVISGKAAKVVLLKSSA